MKHPERSHGVTPTRSRLRTKRDDQRDVPTCAAAVRFGVSSYRSPKFNDGALSAPRSEPDPNYQSRSKWPERIRPRQAPTAATAQTPKQVSRPAPLGHTKSRKPSANFAAAGNAAENLRRTRAASKSAECALRVRADAVSAAASPPLQWQKRPSSRLRTVSARAIIRVFLRHAPFAPNSPSDTPTSSARLDTLVTLPGRCGAGTIARTPTGGHSSSAITGVGNIEAAECLGISVEALESVARGGGPCGRGWRI